MSPGDAAFLLSPAPLVALVGTKVTGFRPEIDFSSAARSTAASSLASAAFSGSKGGTRGNLSSSMRRRSAAATAANSSSGRSIDGTGCI